MCIRAPAYACDADAGAPQQLHARARSTSRGCLALNQHGVWRGCSASLALARETRDSAGSMPVEFDAVCTQDRKVFSRCREHERQRHKKNCDNHMCMKDSCTVNDRGRRGGRRGAGRLGGWEGESMC